MVGVVKDITFWRSASERLPVDDTDGDEFTESRTSVVDEYAVLPPDSATYRALVAVWAETVSLNETVHPPVSSLMVAELIVGAVVSGVTAAAWLPRAMPLLEASCTALATT